MNANIVMYAANISALIMNTIVIMLCLQRKKSLFSTITLYFLFTVLVIAFLPRIGLEIQQNFLRGLLYLPLIFILFHGPVFKKVFVHFITIFISRFLFTFTSLSIRFFLPEGSELYYLMLLIVSPLICAGFLVYLFLSGKKLLNRLFERGTNTEWALYSFSIILLCFAMIATTAILTDDFGLYFLVLLFLLWSFTILCFAIINTHEKTKQKYEADIAREIITSGRGFYEKLTDMTENIHILRHDYKHHLITMQKLLNEGYNDDVKEYLAKLNTNIYDDPLHEYCNNRTINAILEDFVERCLKEKIDFTAQIVLPPDETVDDYELCVILGNLLINAFAACRRTKKDKNRYIILSMRPQEDQFGIKVENSFDGILKHDGKELFNTNDTGMGIKSIKTVAARYNGEYYPVWDEEKFSAFVVLKISH